MLPPECSTDTLITLISVLTKSTHLKPKMCMHAHKIHSHFSKYTCFSCRCVGMWLKTICCTKDRKQNAHKSMQTTRLFKPNNKLNVLFNSTNLNTNATLRSLILFIYFITKWPKSIWFACCKRGHVLNQMMWLVVYWDPDDLHVLTAD